MAQKLLLLAALAFIVPAAAAPLTLHVAKNGNDSWSGRGAAPSGEDGPLATLPEALRRARTERERRPDAVTILIHGGTYRLSEPIVFTPADLSAQQPLTLAAYADEKPVLSGGRPLGGWKPPGKPGLWQADARAGLGTNWQFRSLYINGHRATRARTPNEGSFLRMNGERFNDRPFQFKFRPGDLRPAWVEPGDVEVVAFEKWTDIRQFIRAIDVTSNSVTLSGSSSPHTRESGARYFIENASDAVDAPGEWHLDRQTGLVTCMAKPGENFATSEVIVPILTHLVRFEGDFAAHTPVRHIVLRRLTFADTDWTMPADGYRDSQAAVAIRGDVRADGAVDCAIESCAFARLGGYAIDLGRGCQRNRIAGNDLFDLGAGGVRIGETTRRTEAFDATHSNEVTDNHMHQLGRIYPPAAGVFILQSATNLVAHNHIHDLFYTAVSVGWTWGYQESPCRANVIEFNHLHDIGQGLLSDMGAVYTLGPQPGTVIRNNLIHDVNAFTYGGWGLYTDEGSTGIVLENNIVYRCKSAGFHQHYGRDNVIRNNIFAFGKENQLMRSREEDHNSFFFTNNIVYFDSGQLLGSTWKNDRFVLDQNVYFDTRAIPNVFAGGSLDQWRARGHDIHSVFVDPQFVAPKEGDFAFKPGAPVPRTFRPIDVRAVGVRK